MHALPAARNPAFLISVFFVRWTLFPQILSKCEVSCVTLVLLTCGMVKRVSFRFYLWLDLLCLALMWPSELTGCSCSQSTRTADARETGLSAPSSMRPSWNGAQFDVAKTALHNWRRQSSQLCLPCRLLTKFYLGTPADKVRVEGVRIRGGGWGGGLSRGAKAAKDTATG